MAKVSQVLFLTLIFYLCKPNLSKIVLPRKLRYLENMLTADVVARAAKMRQKIDASNNILENEKSWQFMMKYPNNEKNMNSPSVLYSPNSYFRRRNN